MKKLFLIALALTTLCPKLYGTAHWYVFDGKAVHVISDSVRSLEFGLPPQHVCKLHTGRNAIFISAGHMGALMREPPRQTLVTVYSFDALVTPIMDSAEPIGVKFQNLVQAAKRSLRGSATAAKKLNNPENRDDFRIEGALIWFSDGHAWVKTFNVSVSDWNSITVSDFRPPETKELKQDELHRLPEDEAREKDTAKMRPAAAQNRMTDIDTFLELAMDIETSKSKGTIGPPYARALLLPSGLQWLEGEALCSEKPEAWREWNEEPAHLPK